MQEYFGIKSSDGLNSMSAVEWKQAAYDACVAHQTRGKTQAGTRTSVHNDILHQSDERGLSKEAATLLQATQMYARHLFEACIQVFLQSSDLPLLKSLV